MSTLRKDMILLAGIILTAFLFWLIPLLINQLNRNASASVSVYQDGQWVADYPLTEDLTLAVPWGEDGYNLLLIENGMASVTDATCPDQLCVRQRAISKSGESIICLPHRLVVQIEGEGEVDLDAVTY